MGEQHALNMFALQAAGVLQISLHSIFVQGFLKNYNDELNEFSYTTQLAVLFHKPARTTMSQVLTYMFVMCQDKKVPKVTCYMLLVY